jgi:putative membrane protein
MLKHLVTALRHQRRGRYIGALAVLFAIFWAALAIHPSHRDDWWLENALTIAAVVLLASVYKALPLSRISYTLIFVFLCLHTIGAHYTYAETPYNDWWRALTGHSFNSMVGWERNNFDRVVHFSYGLLLAYPIREVFLRVAGVRGFWGYFLPLDLTMSTSMLYELIEWGAAVTVGSNLGNAYLGSQGDPWDAQKDMALASLGALISMALTAAINRSLQRDFAWEWAESLRVKSKRPLGEEALAKLLKDSR